MEASFPRKPLAMREASLPQGVLLVVLDHLRSVQAPGTSKHLTIFPSARTIVRILVLTKTLS